MPDQPLPQPGREPVTERVIEDLRAREQRGIATYGMTLHTFNGRSALQDLYEELLDAAQYAKQLLMEEATRPVPIDYDRETLGQVVLAACTQWMGCPFGWHEMDHQRRRLYMEIADAVITAYEASRTVLDLDALARLAIKAHGIVLHERDTGTVARYRQMLEQVLPAAYPAEREAARKYRQQWQDAASEAQAHFDRAHEAEQRLEQARRWAALWKCVAREMRDRAATAELAYHMMKGETHGES